MPGMLSKRSLMTSRRKSPYVDIGLSLPSIRRKLNHAIALSSVPDVLISGSSASSGYPVTRSRRLAVSNKILLKSRPGANSNVTTPWFVLASPRILFRPSIPLSSSSCLDTISRSTSVGEAPLQFVLIMMTGCLTSGAIWIGICVSDTQPNNMIISTRAITAVGR